MTLADYQTSLLQAMLQRDALLPQYFTDIPQLATRLAIYQNSIVGTRVRALKTLFPCCEKLLGVRYFTQLAEAYIQQIPATQFMLSETAAAFPEFCRATVVLDEAPYLADMAAFEWLWHQVFDGPNNGDVVPLVFSSDLKFQITPGLKMISSPFPLRDIWQMCQPEYQGDYEMDTTETHYYYALVQRNSAIYIEALTPQLNQLLQTISQQQDDTGFLTTALAELYQRGLILQSD